MSIAHRSQENRKQRTGSLAVKAGPRGPPRATFLPSENKAEHKISQFLQTRRLSFCQYLSRTRIV